MGGGSWTATSYTSYATSIGRTVTTDSLGRATIELDDNIQDTFTRRSLDPALNPKGVIRECRDTEEHPETIPVILALDVTGSMGSAATEVASQLNVIMTELYEKVKDVEFLVMGIGDLAYDDAPVQASQFESDVRIAEQLDKVYFEAGGGGNNYESYTSAWYFGLHHTDLDCWKRGKKGIIITMGDELINPYLNQYKVNYFLGDSLQDDVETGELYKEVTEKFHVYHLSVDDPHSSYNWRKDSIDKSWKSVLGEQNYKVVTVQTLPATITEIVVNCAGEDGVTFTDNTEETGSSTMYNENGEITW